MSDRIDHATEARALLIQCDAFTSSDMVLQTGETKADVIAYAQVHATLALVEQQQLANLIALATEDLTGLGGAARHALGERYGSDAQALRPDIAAALGVKTAKEDS